MTRGAGENCVCVAGKGANTGETECTACSVGTYHELDTAEDGLVACTPCDTGKTAPASSENAAACVCDTANYYVQDTNGTDCVCDSSKNFVSNSSNDGCVCADGYTLDTTNKTCV